MTILDCVLLIFADKAFPCEITSGKGSGLTRVDVIACIFQKPPAGPQRRAEVRIH